jgi:tetratricopeptide (TPR) repeat protein
MFSKKIITLLLFCLSMEVYASLNGAAKALRARGSKASKYRSLVIELVEAKYYFSAIPFMKEYLSQSRSKLDGRLEKAFDEMLTYTGTKQFEVLPIRYLKKSSSNNIKYILAKKYLKSNKTTREAIKYAESINANHPVYPFAAHLLGAAYANLGANNNAIKNYEDCIRTSRSRLSNDMSSVLKKQLRLNQEYCTLGRARVRFAKKDFTDANLLYLDIPKSSYIWPEILIEEAWNSYYMQDFNRTLGKLVTYKAPVLDYIFNPEIEVLNALTYLKMCLYSDAKSVADNFYKKFLNPARKLRTTLRRNRKNYSYFYRMMADFEKLGSRVSGSLTNQILKSISREGAYKELKESYVLAANEMQKVRQISNRSLRSIMASNIAEVVKTQIRIIGAFIKGRMVGKYSELYKAFEGMSYIKLEVLQQRKERLYNFSKKKRSRGDVKYIERNEKQYFWDFNGEFWADELGDYVFALKSEC